MGDKNDALQRRIKELEAKVTILENENASLAERAEEIILFSLTAESISPLTDCAEILDAVLERIAILKNIPYCACFSLTTQDSPPLQSYAAFRGYSGEGDRLIISPELRHELALGAYLTDADSGLLGTGALQLNIEGFSPTAIALLPFESRQIPKGVFVFATDDRRANPMPGLLMLIQRVVEMVVARLDNLALIAELTDLNARLDQKVSQRTSELAASEARYRDLFENAPVAYLAVGVDGIIKRCNQAALELLGFSNIEAFQERTVIDLYADHPQGRPKAKAIFKRFSAGERVWGEEALIQKANGEQIWVSINISATKDENDRVVESRSMLVDITPLKQAEQAIRQLNATLETRVRDRTIALEIANRELEAFTYSVSHDLRAPLRALNGYATLLEQDHCDHLDEEGRFFLEQVRSSAGRMERMIDDLLKLSRISRREIERQEVDLSKMARQIMSELHSQQPDRALDLRIAPDCIAVGDPGLLRLSMQNLLDNAWKFSGKRDCAEIEFGREAQKGRTAFFVRDNGVGFSMDYAHKLFGVFQRLHIDSDFPGTGIGLVIVKRIIQRHNGEIWFQAAPEQGATFYFTLPHTPYS